MLAEEGLNYGEVGEFVESMELKMMVGVKPGNNCCIFFGYGEYGKGACNGNCGCIPS